MSTPIRFTTLYPPRTDLQASVIAGLSRAPRAIAPKYFYDLEGSRLFDAICAQPEYYLPEVEREIFTAHYAEIVAAIGSGAVIIEPGAGSGEKIRQFLADLAPRAYCPLDISEGYLRASAQRLADEFPTIEVHAGCTDFSVHFALPPGLPEGRRVIFFPGSSLGNFEPEDALAFLGRARALAGADGGLLIGIDTKKDPAILNAAYNDRAGMTAAFNLNLLHRIRRELDADLDPELFAHRAFYNEAAGRIEMHLEARDDHEVRVNGHRFTFRRGEDIHTENSYKYRPEEFQTLATQAGWRPRQVWRDERGLFSVHFLDAV